VRVSFARTSFLLLLENVVGSFSTVWFRLESGDFPFFVVIFFSCSCPPGAEDPRVKVVLDSLRERQREKEVSIEGGGGGEGGFGRGGLGGAATTPQHTAADTSVSLTRVPAKNSGADAVEAAGAVGLKSATGW
jgi:hypothetical protein